MGDEYTYSPTVTTEKAKPSHNLESQFHSNLATWNDLLRQSPLNRLRYLDARMAQGATIDKDRVAELVREAGAQAVLSDPDAVGLVRQLFGEKGVQRLKDRARSTAEQT